MCCVLVKGNYEYFEKGCTHTLDLIVMMTSRHMLFYVKLDVYLQEIMYVKAFLGLAFLSF